MIVEKAGVALISKIKGKWYGLCVYQKSSKRWSFPKGSRMSSCETWQSCAKREMAEETGLYIHIHQMNDMNRIVFSSKTAYYVFKPTYCQMKLLTNRKVLDTNEIGDIRWMELNEKKYEFHASVSRVMAEINKKSDDIPNLEKLEKKKMKNMCIVSKWIPTKLFSRIPNVVASKKTSWR